MSRALLAGWFSFEDMGATAGDLMARDLCSRWMTSAGVAHDVAVAAPFRGGVDWRAVDPERYDQVIFVCGPFGNGPPVTDFLGRFAGRRLVGLDLTMLQNLDEWNPFDVLIERIVRGYRDLISQCWATTGTCPWLASYSSSVSLSTWVMHCMTWPALRWNACSPRAMLRRLRSTLDST